MGRPPLCQRHYWFGSGIATRPADAGQIRAPRQQDKSQQVVPGTWRKKKVRLKLLWAGQNGTYDAPAQDSLRYDFLPSFPFIGHNRSVALSSLVPSQALGVLLYQCDKPHSWALVLVINFLFFLLLSTRSLAVSFAPSFFLGFRIGLTFATLFLSSAFPLVSVLSRTCSALHNRHKFLRALCFLSTRRPPTMASCELMKVISVGGNPVSAFLSWRLQATNACDVTLVWKSGFEHVSQYGISFK